MTRPSLRHATAEVYYGKTPFGQLLYDLCFTKLSDKYLARKHGVPIAKMRGYKAAAKRGMSTWRAQRKAGKRRGT